jgi:hypothetical protein
VQFNWIPLLGRVFANSREPDTNTNMYVLNTS